jgi:hypothetical protein
MRLFLASALAFLACGTGLRAGEQDNDRAGPRPATAVTTAAAGGSELDRESPDQSHGWRWRRGWGWGGGWTVGYAPAFGYGYSSFAYPAYGFGYSSFYPSYGWSVGYYRPAFYHGGWSRGCW